jgi:hypothetical protein
MQDHFTRITGYSVQCTRGAVEGEKKRRPSKKTSTHPGLQPPLSRGDFFFSACRSIFLTRKCIFPSRRSIFLTRRSIFPACKCIFLTYKCIFPSRISIFPTCKCIFPACRSIFPPYKCIFPACISIFPSCKSIFQAYRSISRHGTSFLSSSRYNDFGFCVPKMG